AFARRSPIPDQVGDRLSPIWGRWNRGFAANSCAIQHGCAKIAGGLHWQAVHDPSATDARLRRRRDHRRLRKEITMRIIAAPALAAWIVASSAFSLSGNDLSGTIESI